MKLPWDLEILFRGPRKPQEEFTLLVFLLGFTYKKLANAHPTLKIFLTIFGIKIFEVEVSDSKIKYLDP